MRLELWLFLWVSVFVAAYAGVATVPSSEIRLDASISKDLGPAGNAVVPAAAEKDNLLAKLNLLEKEDLGRDLFPAALEVQKPGEAPVVLKAKQELELLGLVKRSDSQFAFVHIVGDNDYRLLGDGETIGDFKIISVLSDRVLIEDISIPKGRRYIELRGRGELPE